jgi:hypothetical protein
VSANALARYLMIARYYVKIASPRHFDRRFRKIVRLEQIEEAFVARLTELIGTEHPQSDLRYD